MKRKSIEDIFSSSIEIFQVEFCFKYNFVTWFGIQRFLEAAEESKKDNNSSMIASVKQLIYKVEMHNCDADRGSESSAYWDLRVDLTFRT